MGCYYYCYYISKSKSNPDWGFETTYDMSSSLYFTIKQVQKGFKFEIILSQTTHKNCMCMDVSFLTVYQVYACIEEQKLR